MLRKSSCGRGGGTEGVGAPRRNNLQGLRIVDGFMGGESRTDRGA
jgi:hypothetical protein